MGFNALKYYIILIIFLFNLSSVDRVKAKDYAVGDEEGWTMSARYMQWSAKYNFSVGDVLVFKYVQGQHNTFEVTQETYQTCDNQSGVLASYFSGHDRVTLAEAKKYWFICAVPGHCLGGMKFTVDVNKVDDDNSVQPSEPSINGVGIIQWSRWAWAYYIVAFVMLVLKAY
ncbi:mavicyanin-like [Magnolia sinica]|uniref:mavicyanin-like n=1 Tax=Magnolia sinica TaxID=86752 RepID=UPI00265B5942|nr:mavicyanin-like [Magnolia sinica]